MSASKVAIVAGDDHRRPQSPGQRLLRGIGFKEIRRLASATLHHAVVAAALIFYSRGILGVAIRIFVGA